MGVSLSFHHMDSGDGIYILRLGNRCLYPLNHLTGPRGPFRLTSSSHTPGLSQLQIENVQKEVSPVASMSG